MAAQDNINVHKSPEHGSTIARRSANYQPNQWDYSRLNSLTSNYTEEAYGYLAKRLKEAVRALLFNETDPFARLRLIDSVDRLGLGYHFEEEVKGLLNDMLTHGFHKVAQIDGLHATATFFRLLRQHGLVVSDDIFNHFKDDGGKFKASLSQDVKGLLSLYQASYLSLGGESLLDAARDFAAMQLKSSDATKSGVAGEVARALDVPSHWRPPRLEARRHIESFETEAGIDSTLLRFAKLDFNMVQNIHQSELVQITRWSMSLNLGKELSFARDRTLECFFGSVLIVFQPQFGYCREWLPKVGALLAAHDDLYDIYGSLDELEFFTCAVDRWEITQLENLPKFLKTCFTAIDNIVEEMAQAIQRHTDQLDILPYLRKSWADLCKSFLMEAKWQNDKHIPTFSEYINNGWMSSGGPLILLHAFLLLTQAPTEEELEHLKSYPKIIRLASTVFRLCNDLATSTAELERGDAPTSIQCYMKETCVSEIVAREHVSSMIAETWEGLNQECMLSSPFPRPFVEACANLARMAVCLYQHRDGFSIPTYETKGHIISLLMEPLKL